MAWAFDLKIERFLIIADAPVVTSPAAPVLGCLDESENDLNPDF